MITAAFLKKGGREAAQALNMYTIKFWHSFLSKIASEAAENVAVCKWIFAHFFLFFYYYLCFRCST